MPSLTYARPALPGLAGSQPYAPWPVWSGSTTQEVRFQPLPKKAAVRLWHQAREFDRRTHQPGHHGGAVGPSALQVLHTLIFDFLNFRTGRLDPSYAAIARQANVCKRTVASALKRLKELGILNWVRRCAATVRDGRFTIEQETNAYALLPSTQWRGYRPPSASPAPAPGTWGDPPPLPSLLAQALTERREGGSLGRVAGLLETDPGDKIAAALARLGRALASGNSQ